MEEILEIKCNIMVKMMKNNSSLKITTNKI